MTKEERISLFNRELSYINDEKLRKFAEYLLENADDYFFTVPASSSGKYHPAFAKGEGGLVRHTRAVAYFANDFARSELEFKTITPREADLLIIAAIAHDIKKQGDGSTGHTMLREHPALGAEYIEEMSQHFTDTLTEDDITFLYNAVLAHMGPWGDVKPETFAERALFYADYAASRSELDIKFISEGCTDAVEKPITPVMDVDTYVFHFGKTKGMTIKEAVEKNRGYVDWIANNKSFNMKDIQELIHKYYDKNNLPYDKD